MKPAYNERATDSNFFPADRFRFIRCLNFGSSEVFRWRQDSVMPRLRLRQVSLLITLKKGLIVQNTYTWRRICIIYFFCVFTKYCHSVLFKREMKSFSTFSGKTWRQRQLGRTRRKGKILKSVLKEYIAREWAADHWWALVNTVMNLMGGYKSGHLQEPEHVVYVYLLLSTYS